LLRRNTTLYLILYELATLSLILFKTASIMAKTSKEGIVRATVPAKFLFTCLLICSVVAFSVGRITRFYLVPDFEAAMMEYAKARVDGKDGGLLPTPKAQAGKIIPHTIYTTKNFDTRLSALTASQWLQPADAEEGSDTPNESPTNNIPEPINEKLSFDENGDADYDKDEEEHLPAGQHLLVDIDGLEAAFLNSEARLATAMLSMVDNSGLTLLSYHCHGLYPEGVSCAGVLLESHVAFHTWPTEGVITLDLFTCGSTSLLDSMVLIEDLFVIPRNPEEKPNVMWAYKRRGFNEQTKMIGERDTFAYPLGVHGMEYKKEVRNILTSGLIDVLSSKVR
jgi:S-adenosylmethionine decarboxylase proenzyme